MYFKNLDSLPDFIRCFFICKNSLKAHLNTLRTFFNTEFNKGNDYKNMLNISCLCPQVST